MNVVTALFGASISYQGVYLYHLTLIISVAWLLFNGEIKTLNLRKLVDFKFFYWIGLVLIAVFSLSLLWAENLSYGINYIIKLLIGLSTVFIIVRGVDSSEKLVKIERLIGYFLLFSVCWSIVEIIFGVSWPISQNNAWSDYFGYNSIIAKNEFEFYYYNVTPKAFFWNPNNWAMLLVIVYPILLLSKKNNTSSFVLFILLVLFFTGSRISFILLVTTHILYSIFIRRDIFKKYLLSTITIASCLIVPPYLATFFTNKVLAQVLTFKTAEYWGVINRIVGYEIVSFSNLPAQSNDSVRKELLETGVNMFIETNGLGVGAGNVNYLLKLQGGVGDKQVTDLHNFWLELLVNGGSVIGGALLVWFILLLVKLKKQKQWPVLVSVLVVIPAAIAPSSCIYFLPFYVFWAWVLLKIKYHKHESFTISRP